MGIASRITNTGILYVNGIFDETSFSSTSPAIYNLVTYTQQLDNAFWTPTSGITATGNSITSPNNTTTATLLTGNGVSVGYLAPPLTYTSGLTYTFSCYFKAGTQTTGVILLYGTNFGGVGNPTGVFNLSTGSTAGSSATAYGMTLVGNGWYRCWISQTCTITGSQFMQMIRMASATGTVYVWGYQLEVVSTPSEPSTYQGVAATGVLVPPGFATRTTSNTIYVTDIFDEVSGMIDTDGLLLYVNGSSNVYSGSETQWLDLSSYKNNATLTGSPTYNAGTGGGSFAFNGSTQSAPVTTALLNTTYTGKTVFFVGRLNAAAWTSGVAQFRAMFGSDSAPRNFNFYVYHDAANAIYFHYSTPGSAFITNSVSLNTNTWFIAAVTQDTTTTTVYLNGVSIYSVAGQTLNQYANGGVEAVAKADNYWYGDVAVCALYSRALSAAEILNNYNAFASRVGLTPTVNTPSNRDTSNGTRYVTNYYDEFTGAPVVDSSLKLWLDAAQTASYPGTGTTWTDLSSTGNNGTLVNSPIYSSANGGSLEFNGTNNYINVPSTSSLQFLNRAPYSFEVWVYPIADNSASYPGFINRESNPGTGRDGYNLYYTNLGVAVGSHLIATERFCTGTQISAGATYTDAVFFNNWQCYCTTYDGTTLRFYRNGVIVSSATSTGNITNTTQNVTIGQRGGVYSNSKISATKFYDKALSADEVSTNFNALRNRYGI